MKKVFVMMGMLLSLGLFCACSSDEEIFTRYSGESSDSLFIFYPIEEGEGYAMISDFFDSELPFDTYSKGLFVDSGKNVGEEICKIVNSRKEFEDIYSGDKILPEIDFQQYTLVIGQIIMPVWGYKCITQKIVSATMDNSPIIDLYIENTYELNPAVLWPLYFWGIYPKMNLSNLKINIVIL